MGNTGNYTGDTEEIFIDEEEFEAMLASERERAQTVNDSFSEGETVIELIDDDDYFESEGVGAEEFVEEELPEDDYAEDNTVIYSKADIEDYIDEPEPEYVVPAPKKSKKTNKYNNMDASEDEFEFEDEGGEENGIVNIFAGGFGDKLIYLTGALIILFALIVGVVLITGKTRKNIAGPDMGDIGLSVAEINLIGEEGLNNVFGHEAARLSDLYEAAESFEYSEVDEETGLVNVDLALTSILKDLKVKFVNKNNKLVAGVPFQAEVTDSKGNTKVYTDDDKDGIIYLTDLAGGEYSVKIVKLSGFDALYSFNESKATIKVKDQIEYTKVDVSNEVKKESQVDVKKEDTKVNETVEESKLPDTVEFVISKQESLTDPSGYTEISKDKVKNPMDQYTSQNSAKAGKFMKLEDNVSPNDPSPTYSVNGLSVADSIAGGTNSSASVDVTGNIKDVSWTSSDASLQITKDANDAKKANIVTSAVTTNTSVTITATVTFENDNSVPVSKTVTVTADASYFDGAGSVGVLYPGTSIDLSKVITYTIKDKTGKVPSNYTISYSSSNTAVVSVSGSTITGVAVGTAKITATCTADNMTTKTKDFDVTVSASNVKIKLNYSKLTVFYDGGDPATLTATVEGAQKDKTVTWKSSDEGVVTVSDSGALTAHKAGSATITCTSKEDKNVTATCSITAVVHPSKDTTQLLKDAEGNQLYVKNGNSFVEAKFANYYDGSKLYKATKVEYKYTGWWTISGKTYYYDKNGNKVTGEQVILGTKYNFASDGSLISGNGSFGIDVSKFNGTIDWNSVAKSGVSYAIIRCGFRGSTAGGLIEDSKFATNIKNANAAGIKVGVYFFTQAVNEVEAVEEASMVLGQVAGYKISYPIFLDVESAGAGARAEGLSREQRTAVIKAFCKTISNGGYTAGFYANKYWLNNKINSSELTAYKIWLAHYTSNTDYTATRYDLWQYTSSGSISGISGNVDLDRSYLGY